MGQLYFSDVISQLEKLIQIYEIIPQAKKEIQKLEQIIFAFKPYEKYPIDVLDREKKQADVKQTVKKQPFSEVVKLLFSKKFNEIKGTKIDYHVINSPETVINYFEQTSSSKIMKEATALDLKLLYCLLINESQEIKGNKDEVFRVIKNNIRARKRGKAFANN